jgi:hypothetical protein
MSSAPAIFGRESNGSECVQPVEHHASVPDLANLQESELVGCCTSLCNAIMSKLQEDVWSVPLPVDVSSTEFSTKSTVCSVILETQNRFTRGMLNHGLFTGGLDVEWFNH